MSVQPSAVRRRHAPKRLPKIDPPLGQTVSLRAKVREYVLQAAPHSVSRRRVSLSLDRLVVWGATIAAPQVDLTLCSYGPM